MEPMVIVMIVLLGMTIPIVGVLLAVVADAVVLAWLAGRATWSGLSKQIVLADPRARLRAAHR